jgi:hypothetical protein
MKTGFSFKDALVASGTKSVNEAYPELVLTSSYNGFRINRKAAKMLGVDEGDRVLMFDAKYTGAESEEDRYYIGKEVVAPGNKPQGAKIGKSSNSFNYSGIYGTMLANDFEISSITTDELIAKGLMEKRTTTNDKGETFNSYISLFTGSAELVPFQEGEPVEIEEGVEMVLYQVTKFKLTPHNPKTMKKEGGEEAGEEVDYADTEEEA